MIEVKNVRPFSYFADYSLPNKLYMVKMDGTNELEVREDERFDFH